MTDQPDGLPRDEIEYDPATGTYRLAIDPAGDEPLGSVIVTAVAAVRDVEPFELASLHSIVDVDALNELFAPLFGGTPRIGGRVSFPFAECTVIVSARGYLVIDPNDAGDLDE